MELSVMSEPQVTIVVVPRERFSFAERSLESIYEHTKFPFTLIYVDGGSPNNLKSYLEAESQKKEFQLIRTEHYLTPNEARNLGLGQVKTKYVVFIDNDVLVTPGWLEKLVQCAEETGAWVVGTLYFVGEVESQIIHMAGGVAYIKEVQNGKRIIYEKHLLAGKHIVDLPVPPQREPCGIVEFHCMLVSTQAFERLGPLDEEILNTREHVDFCLSVREAGGSVYLEADSIVSYVPPPPLTWSDLPFFLVRWGETWSFASFRRLEKKWNVVIPDSHIYWLRSHRYIPIEPWRNLLRRVFGNLGAKVIEKTLLFPMEKAVNRYINTQTTEEFFVLSLF